MADSKLFMVNMLVVIIIMACNESLKIAVARVFEFIAPIEQYSSFGFFNCDSNRYLFWEN
jgi:hypothetical protein